MRSHRVHVYEDDASLAAGVGGFLSQGMRAGERVLVIATAEHHQAFEPYRRGPGEWVALDAEATLGSILVDGEPDAARFKEVIDEALGPVGAPCRAYGEMVEVLARRGHYEAALRLERLWNTYATAHAFALLCAYATGTFTAAQPDMRRRICLEHESVHASALAALGVVDHLIIQAKSHLGLEVGIPHRSQTPAF